MPRHGKTHWIRRYDWDAIAGIVAAAAAIVLHLLHVLQLEVLLTITLVLVALLLLRQLRHEEREERVEDMAGRTEQMIVKLHDVLKAPEVVLVGPRHLRTASETFARQARGDMVWFNVCLMMFRPQELFDCLLRPAVENPRVTRIQFVLDEGERANWRDHVVPKLAACAGEGRRAALVPRLVELAQLPDGGVTRRRQRSIHSTNVPGPSTTSMTRSTRSSWYICLAPARASSLDA